MNRRYALLVERVTARPLLVLIGLVPLIVVAAFAFTRVGSGFMPSMDEGGFVLDYHTEPGTSVTETDRLMKQIEGDHPRESECRDLFAPHRRGPRRRSERSRTRATFSCA